MRAEKRVERAAARQRKNELTLAIKKYVNEQLETEKRAEENHVAEELKAEWQRGFTAAEALLVHKNKFIFHKKRLNGEPCDCAMCKAEAAIFKGVVR